MRKPGRRLRRSLFVIVTAAALYLLLWPVPIAPVAWKAPADRGLTGPFASNDRLAGMQRLSLGGHEGSEDVAVDVRGRIYVCSRSGDIVRLEPDGTHPTVFASTGGRPLGIAFDADGNLIVADAYKGLMSVSPGGEVRLLADHADGLPILYADDVDVAPDGRIYFSDASTKFSAKAVHDTMEAFQLETFEHAATGRLLVYDPSTKRATTVLSHVAAANGVAVSPDGTFVLLDETASYRVLRVWIAGPRKGQVEPLVTDLPGFPDNVSTGMDGRFWVALVLPRDRLLDAMSGHPFLRKVTWRLPSFMRATVKTYEHVVAFDASGRVLADLQGAAGNYPLVTSVAETASYLYLGSLVAKDLGRIPKRALGLN